MMELVERCAFHRGLIAEVKLSLDRFVELAEVLCTMAPIQHLSLHGPCDRWAEFLALPQLRQMVSLEFTYPDLDDEMVCELANVPSLTSLRALYLEKCKVGRRGVEALAASPYLERVVNIGLDRTQYDPLPTFWDDFGIVNYEPNPRGDELAMQYGRRPWLVGPPVELYRKWIPVHDLYAADDYGTSLALTGQDGDETRVLYHPTKGYSVVVPGRPRLELDPRGMPGYDAVVRLEDVPVEIGVQFEQVGELRPYWMGPVDLTKSYVQYRTYSRVEPEPMKAELVPAGAAAAMDCLYVLRQKPRLQMEYLVTSQDRLDAESEVVYLTVRFASEDLNPACWANLRAALLAGQRWDGTHAQLPGWPASVFASSDARMELTPPAWAEAQAKARAVVAVPDAEAEEWISRLTALATGDEPPWAEVTAEGREAVRMFLAGRGGEETRAVLERKLDEVTTAHDLRAWCWQNMWALINRKRCGGGYPPLDEAR